VHWFGVAGLANGLAVMRDEETKSLWDHITGECFDGPLAGRRLDFWQVHITNVAAEVAAHPDTILLKSGHQSLRGSIMRMFLGKRMRYTNEGTMLAPNFRSTMHQQIDPRLPEGEQGLGLTKELNQGKFYPVKLIPSGGEIEDEWLGRRVRITRNEIDGVPFAMWADTGEAPMQLLSRWYGFSFTYPDCEIYSG
ncbi:MAG: DUF3179 domain-containing protein, partial [Anaerolineae bacterium]|nr:DUF3179 domain-containing protein [Anaerolineae bacterium]